MLWDTPENGLYISNDKGINFNKINSEYILGLDIVKTAENKVKIYYTTDTGVFISEDDGNTFNKIDCNNFPIMQNRHPQNLKVSSVDANNMVMYVGKEQMKNGAYNVKGDIYYTLDGGNTWKVVSINGSNSIISTKNGDYGGVEPTSINVKPETGELWASGNCTGLSKLTPPYKISQNTNPGENNNQNTQKTEESNNTENNNNTIIKNESKEEPKDSNTEPEKSENEKEILINKLLPFAGKKQFIIYVIIISIVIAIKQYLKYKKYVK